MADFDPTSGITLTNPLPGSTLAAWLNELAPFVLSSGYGTVAPANAETGMIWSMNTGGTPDAYIFGGAASSMLFSVANILGTVSADGAGENTGAIIEVGYTSGTLWAKFAGGIAICARMLTSHLSGTETWALPINFTDTGKMFCAAASNNTANPRLISLDPVAVDEVDLYEWNLAGSTANTDVSAIVIGFWTEEFV